MAERHALFHCLLSKVVVNDVMCNPSIKPDLSPVEKSTILDPSDETMAAVFNRGYSFKPYGLFRGLVKVHFFNWRFDVV